jgi:hypothetical protein
MMERKGFAPSATHFKLSEAGDVEVAFAQLSVVDRDGDLTEPGAFPVKDVPMSAYGHTSWMGALPTGKGGILESDGWAIFTGGFLMETDQGRNAYHTVKAMADLQEWSYGYDPLDYTYETRDAKTVRVLRKLDVFEVSPVLVGAGIGTHTRGIKGAPGAGMPYADHLALVAEQVKAIAERSSDRAAFRAKDGRALSGTNREMLASLLASLDESSKSLRTLLDESDPDRGLAALIEQARFLGVPV